jgi:hypothetical protein
MKLTLLGMIAIIGVAVVGVLIVLAMTGTAKAGLLDRTEKR